MFYITTPIPYTNAQAHLGHLLEGVFTDTIARFYRRVDEKTVLSMGLDQHGLKIYQKAIEVGQSPEAFVAEQGRTFKSLWARFNVMPDVFIETSLPGHKAIAQIAWRKMAEQNLIYKKSYEGLYCISDEAFVNERDMVNGACPNHPEQKLVLMKEENYFFKISIFKRQIQDFLQSADIQPEYVKKEFLNFLQEDLQDISISREKSKLPWGIDVPGDDSQVMYVWFDALLNYLTGAVNPPTLEHLALDPGNLKLTESAWHQIQEHLPIDLLYVGKDIARFHLITWIGMLLALGLPLPKKALVHGFINDANGRKFSKSLGNGVFPSELADKFGIDGSRFILLYEMNVDGDTNFDWNKITEAYNAHLADNIGNLLMRVTTLVEKFLNGIIDVEDVSSPFDFSEVYERLHKLDTKGGLDIILAGSAWGNELLEKEKPWMMMKEGKIEETKIILNQLCKLLLDLSEVLSIFLPDTAQEIYDILTTEQIQKAKILFPKIDLN